MLCENVRFLLTFLSQWWLFLANTHFVLFLLLVFVFFVSVCFYRPVIFSLRSDIRLEIAINFVLLFIVFTYHNEESCFDQQEDHLK